MAEMPDLLGMAPCAVGAFAAIAAVAFLSFEHGVPLFMASLGASAVILFSMPGSAAARPRNVIAGHLMSAAIGVALVHILGPTWFAAATAVTSSIVLMAVTGTTHPPGGATALIAVTSCATWGFVIAPVGLGAAVLVVVAALTWRAQAPKGARGTSATR